MRAVDEYTVHPWGLYLARPTPGRAQFHYLESWLLPSLGLRATVFHFNPSHKRDHDYYLDVGEYTPGPSVWRSEDHYLDIEVRTDGGVELRITLPTPRPPFHEELPRITSSDTKDPNREHDTSDQ